MSSLAGAGAALTAREQVMRSRVRIEEKDFIVFGVGKCYDDKILDDTRRWETVSLLNI